jgi:hypothetical protein
VAATDRGAENRVKYDVGQIVGRTHRVRPTRPVVLDLVTEHAEVAGNFVDEAATSLT